MSATRLDSMSVLVIVEDEPDMRLMIRGLLSVDSRIEVVGEAASLDEAMDVATTHAPGLIVLDHQIEGTVMGLEAAPLLKAIVPDAKILLFSAFDMADQAANEPAIDLFLSKSDVGRLLSTVQHLLGLSG